MESKECLICNRIKSIRENKNPYFVEEMNTGYVVIGDHQFFRGYTLFLCKHHKKELHELEPGFRKEFLWEMSEVASAVFKTFKPQKLNYELLGNTDAHMHWHIFPRHENDIDSKRPVWVIDEKIRCAVSARPSEDELEDLKDILRKHLGSI